ncbi:helix-turn-helix transcriptional regulator [Paraburkholderia sediminicola]|uniref:helix-turn-helix transcriptional regulator n=1 Tax=Paraburkholderia sediminicola TaxID=458836 RepID=UPI0038BB5C98
MSQTNERLIRLTEVMNRTALTRATLYRLMDKSDFPKPVKITATAVAWPESSVNEWIAGRIEAAKGAN